MNRIVQLLRGLSTAALNHPLISWVFAGAAVALSIFLVVNRLELKTSNLDLVDHQVPAIERFMAFSETFGTPNVLIVVLEGDDVSELSQAAERLAPELEGVAGVRHMMYKVPLDEAWLRELDFQQYMMSDDQRSLYLFIQPEDVRSSAAETEPLVRGVRAVLEGAQLDLVGVRAGLTGIPEYALNDKEFIQRDIKVLSLFALGAVLLIFVMGFRSWRDPLIAIATLVVGCVLTLGVTSILPGHLTLLSASFISILFGLGIDYGIHLIKRIHEFADQTDNYRQAVMDGLDSLYRSLLTGALTTSCVFFGMRYSGLKGFSELGFIAGVGVLLCFVCMITLLPAGLLLIRSGGRKKEAQPKPVVKHIRFGGVSAAVLTLLFAAALWQPSPPFNSDYLALQPEGSEAVRLERAMISGSGFSPEFAGFEFDSETEAARFADRLLDEPLVGEVRTLAGVSEIGLPPDQTEKLMEMFADRFLSGDGRYAVYAYPSENIWIPEEQERFAGRMKELDSGVTGMPIIGQYMFEQSNTALRRMSPIALAVLAVFLLMDFRRVRLVLVAMAPTLMAFGMMRLWASIGDVSFNPINIMALPVILGISVDDGVHIVHRFIQEKGDIAATMSGTGRTVLMTSLTSMSSFGALAFGLHRGLASFGLLVFLGVLSALMTSLFWLPWVLHRFRKYWLSGMSL